MHFSQLFLTRSMKFHWIFNYHSNSSYLCPFSYPNMYAFTSLVIFSYQSKKKGSLFCFVVMRSIEPGFFRSCSWCLWKAFHVWWVHGLGSMMFGLAVQKFLNIEMISSLKTKFNRSWIFLEELECAFGVVGKILMPRIKWNLFGKIGFIMWEILILKWFLPLKIQINSKKPGFGRKSHLRTW